MSLKARLQKKARRNERRENEVIGAYIRRNWFDIGDAIDAGAERYTMEHEDVESHENCECDESLCGDYDLAKGWHEINADLEKLLDEPWRA